MPRLVATLQSQVEQGSKMVGREGHKAIQDEAWKMVIFFCGKLL